MEEGNKSLIIWLPVFTYSDLKGYLTLTASQMLNTHIVIKICSLGNSFLKRIVLSLKMNVVLAGQNIQTD